MWFTLADCIAAKLLTGHAPRVVRALSFMPGKPQPGLNSVAINGDAAFRVRPRLDNFYRRLIELRQQVKRQRDRACGPERERLDALQYALKIAANATSYGIFAEVNVIDSDKSRPVRVHTGTGVPFTVMTRKVEEPGRYFHPLVATLITGAARLMLALAERLATDAGLDWAFCDTDSIAIAEPEGSDAATFHARVDGVVAQFEALNPYGFGGSVLKVEDVNAVLDDPAARDPLFCYAVSAKRYALFNVDAAGLPVIRKASAHGLGHLRPPYDASNPAVGIPAPRVSLSELGVARWQHDLWWLIARAALHGPVVPLPLDHHPAMQAPALSRYGATTPAIHRWFDAYNAGKPYDAQVRPFGFLNALTGLGGAARPVAPFERDPGRSAASAFDRNTGAPIEPAALKSYARALAQYHLHAEAKFGNGRPLDSGVTQRRHVVASGAAHIGKEADRWEEQFFIGPNPDATVEYGSAPNWRYDLAEDLKSAAAQVGERELADALGISRVTLQRLLRDPRARISDRTRSTITHALPRFWAAQQLREGERARALDWLHAVIEQDGLIVVARRLGCDPANLAAMRRGRRALPHELLGRITAAINAPPRREQHQGHEQRDQREAPEQAPPSSDPPG